MGQASSRCAPPPRGRPRCGLMVRGSANSSCESNNTIGSGEICAQLDEASNAPSATRAQSGGSGCTGSAMYSASENGRVSRDDESGATAGGCTGSEMYDSDFAHVSRDEGCTGSEMYDNSHDRCVASGEDRGCTGDGIRIDSDDARFALPNEASACTGSALCIETGFSHEEVGVSQK